MRVYIRSMDYENIQLAEGVRLFVAESELPITTQAAEGGVDADVTSEAEAGKRVGGGRGICGFVLLDPLFRDGGAYGYVTSINRMFRSSHPGEWAVCVWVGVGAGEGRACGRWRGLRRRGEGAVGRAGRARW